MFKVRDNEPDYALLNDPANQEYNRYGEPIQKAQEGDLLHGQSLNINQDSAIGTNPNRYKQHGFFFNADNCIACHACEAACSEKNDNPAHIAFRSVGFVEGGSYPNTQRLNISMACNHCDDPVCLKGCPTRAYTKFAEYGAVLQDPDICFGCGYCTWVCPYNAPQLDPVQGQVTKCNMCVDRLEVGLKPACVSACLGKALDFGVIENIPQGCDQAKTEIPGFPRADITHPNIRFQQTRTTQREMVRADSASVKYHRDDTEGSFHPVVDPKSGYKRAWNLGKLLGSHENAHIIFTLCVQMVMGAFLLLTLGSWIGPDSLGSIAHASSLMPTLLTMLLLMGVGLYKLNMHLGKPHRFYRGFYNLRWSPVSREIAGVSLFFAALAGYALANLFAGVAGTVLQVLFGLMGLLGGGIGGYYMYRLYRIEARPFWNHWHTGASFMGTALSLGALLLGLTSLLFAELSSASASVLALVIATGMSLEGIGLLFHYRDLREDRSEGAVSHYQQTTEYGNAYWTRNGLLMLGISIALLITATGTAHAGVYLLLALVTLVASVIGRALFYVVVIPTTMPGAFFWRNKGFVEHARESGLASMPQVGVEYERHHAFKLGALIETLRNTSVKEKLLQVQRILTG